MTSVRDLDIWGVQLGFVLHREPFYRGHELGLRGFLHV